MHRAIYYLKKNIYGTLVSINIIPMAISNIKRCRGVNRNLSTNIYNINYNDINECWHMRLQNNWATWS